MRRHFVHVSLFFGAHGIKWFRGLAQQWFLIRKVMNTVELATGIIGIGNLCQRCDFHIFFSLLFSSFMLCWDSIGQFDFFASGSSMVPEITRSYAWTDHFGMAGIRYSIKGNNFITKLGEKEPRFNEDEGMYFCIYEDYVSFRNVWFLDQLGGY